MERSFSLGSPDIQDGGIDHAARGSTGPPRAVSRKRWWPRKRPPQRGTQFAIYVDFVYTGVNLGGRVCWKVYTSLMLGTAGDVEGGGSGLPASCPIPFRVA
jgi:hypothetical protein